VWAENFSEISVLIYQAAHCHVPEEGNIHQHDPESLKHLNLTCYYRQQGQTVFELQPAIFLVVRLHGDKIEKNEMGWACGAYG